MMDGRTRCAENAVHPDAASFGPGYRIWLLALTLAVAAFGFIDRVLIATLAEAIKKDLGLTDFQLGILGGLSFAALYSTVGLPIARLAERHNRVNIISASVALFSGATVLCGLAANFLQLFLLRIGVGFGEAGVQSPTVSLLADHFPRERRGAVTTIMKLGSPLGSVIGALAAGWIGSAYGWRVAVISISVPGIVVAILFRLTLREPPRGMSDPAAERDTGDPPPLSAVIRMMRARPEFRQLLIALALVTIGMYGTGAFYAPFFMRAHGLSLSEVGVFYAIQTGIAGTIGIGIAGFGVDLIARREAKWYALVPAIGVASSVPFNLVGYSVNNPQVALVFLIAGACLAFFHNVPTLVALQNMVGARMRATAAFVFFFVTTLVGIGLGPVVLGFVSDLYAGAAFAGGDYAGMCHAGTAVVRSSVVQERCAAASTAGIRYALLSGMLFYLWSAMHYYLASRAMRSTL